MTERRCGNCEFWEYSDYDEDTGNDTGFCRRHAPRPVWVIEDEDQQHGEWPFTYGHMWCGEFRPRAVAESATTEGADKLTADEWMAKVRTWAAAHPQRDRPVDDSRDSIYGNNEPPPRFALEDEVQRLGRGSVWRVAEYVRGVHVHRRDREGIASDFFPESHLEPAHPQPAPDWFEVGDEVELRHVPGQPIAIIKHAEVRYHLELPDGCDVGWYTADELRPAPKIPLEGEAS